MIQIAGRTFRQIDSLNLGSVEKEIAEKMSVAAVAYSYPSNKDFLFELKYRKNMIESAKQMSEGKAVFTTFAYASCNPAYWDLTSAGGFRLRSDVNPSDAVRDIFTNSALYAFECATACVIIYYHAVLNSIGRSDFDSIFQDLYLYSWHTDADLGIHTFYGNHILPGDVVYFNNPDYSPDNPWYRGVNAVVMEDGRFFGHGLGIMSDKEILGFLDNMRKEGSDRSAYLTSLITRLSFNSAAGYGVSQWSRKSKQHIVAHHNKDSISCIRYRRYLYKGKYSPY
ncbi:protein-glutamine gamma-glutamyltransferase [Bacillus sp. SG-1]|uniref:protein-glutamine gamma-glutamyltransferase n=1 Tax=Bacillus sp. SG-1 TaxID=161544 RepID=UPI00031B3D16|nr:protein-glutamine gamma-glutamyltransferase [Bacillus sp. SG-1]